LTGVVIIAIYNETSQRRSKMTYLIADITFYKVDEDGEEIKDKNGNTKLYQPKGRWKDLEYLCEDRDDDNFEEITQ
jgi:hypothetical protein